MAHAAGRLQANHFTVMFNGQKALEWEDETFKIGKVGVWTKADSVTCLMTLRTGQVAISEFV